MLKLTPDNLRDMTPREFTLTMDGHLLSIGKKQNKTTWNDVLDMADKAGIR